MHYSAAEHSFLAPGFRSAVLSLVAGGIPRTDGRATLGVGRPIHLRQPRLERFSRANGVSRNSSSRSEAAPRVVRLKLDATRPCPLRGRTVLRSSGFASSPDQNQ